MIDEIDDREPLEAVDTFNSIRIGSLVYEIGRTIPMKVMNFYYFGNTVLIRCFYIKDGVSYSQHYNFGELELVKI